MKILLMITMINLFGKCSKEKIWKDDELSIQRTNYSGSQLRIDGFYYLQKDNNYYDCYCFYGNGVVIAAGGLRKSVAELSQYLEKEFINSDSYKKYKSNWGVFKIEGNSIQFERWYPSDPPLKAYVKAGEIINDSTFVIKEIYRMQGGQKTEVESRNEVYHFKAFSPKPDSTNSFVK